MAEPKERESVKLPNGTVIENATFKLVSNKVRLNYTNKESTAALADQILALIKEAGYKSPEELKSYVKLAELATCPNCKSIWVCWNWMHAWGGDRKKYEGMNPTIPSERLLDWGHECWNCDASFETKEKVTNGIPYEFLRNYYREARRVGEK